MGQPADAAGVDDARDAPLWFPTAGPVFLVVAVVLSALSLVAGVLTVFLGPFAIAAAVSAKVRGQRGATAVLVVAVVCFFVGITVGVLAGGSVT